jgi:hypothetical protein
VPPLITMRTSVRVNVLVFHSFRFRTQHYNYHHRYRSLLTFYPSPNLPRARTPVITQPAASRSASKNSRLRLPALRLAALHTSPAWRAHRAARGTACSCSRTRLSARGRLRWCVWPRARFWRCVVLRILHSFCAAQCLMAREVGGGGAGRGHRRLSIDPRTKRVTVEAYAGFSRPVRH